MRKRALMCGVVALAAMFTIAPHARADHPSWCKPLQDEWASLQNGGLDAVADFRIGLTPKQAMCPTLVGSVDERIAVLTRQRNEVAQQRERLEQEAQQSQAARTQLTQLENTLQRERQARQRAEQDAATLRRIREAEEAAAQAPGRVRNLVACSMSQDVARFDRGNIPGVQVENLQVPPEIQAVYDIADINSGAVDVYSWDLPTRQWSRVRMSATRQGNVLTIGATRESEHNARLRERATLNLDAMTVNGAGLFEAITTGQQSAVTYDGNSGNANVNLGALFQRGPRIWLETRGVCAYQNGGPPGPLTSTPEWHIATRDIPTIPNR